MTDNKARQRMPTATTDVARGCAVCETPREGHRQLITLAIKYLPSLTSNYFSKRQRDA